MGNSKKNYFGESKESFSFYPEMKEETTFKKREPEKPVVKRRGVIIMVCSDSVCVKFEDGQLGMVMGYTERKVGDSIEI